MKVKNSSLSEIMEILGKQDQEKRIKPPKREIQEKGEQNEPAS